jgi:hypothetical protein
MKTSTFCHCCGSSNILKSPGVLMPFMAKMIFDYNVFDLDDSWNLYGFQNSKIYFPCKSAQCQICGFLFSDMRFDNDELNNLYSSYREKKYSETREFFEPGYLIKNNLISENMNIINEVENFLDFAEERTNILDWGGDDGKNTPFLQDSENIFIYDLSDKELLDKCKKINYSELVATAEKQIRLIEKINNSNAPLSIKLEDGSVIALAKNAKLSYPKHFEPNKRQVFLSGEAFFEITKNPQKPFYVYSNEVITKVLGTSFTIKAFEDSPEVIVSVKTGKVSVFHQNKIAFADPEEKALIITPNQQIVFARKEESLTKSLVERPILIKDLSQLPEQNFEDKPVSEVLKAIEQAYGVHIIYDAEQLSHCIITTTLANESLYSKLDIMCKTIGASYKIVDAQIVIQSMGCN